MPHLFLSELRFVGYGTIGRTEGPAHRRPASTTGRGLLQGGWTVGPSRGKRRLAPVVLKEMELGRALPLASTGLLACRPVRLSARLATQAGQRGSWWFLLIEIKG